ncbi:MAG: DegT/DnrJ/EryC1/StrS family aminotransferase [Synergistaceae bacterium]|nr:DegT/DnrJ/EryC1/StrS family aminotransferase [Synergistaceae bacterium]
MGGGVIPGQEADAVVYSFQAVKNLPTADSGMICFKDGRLDEVVRKIGWLGINKDTYTRATNSGNYKWRYDVEYIGEKAHGNSVIAAIGLVQLKYLDRDNAYRRQIAKWYREGFEGHDEKIRLVKIPSKCESSTHLFQIFVENRDETILKLNANEIYPGVHYADNTEYKMYCYDNGKCPNAAYASDHILSLPMHMFLSYEDVSFIVSRVLEYAVPFKSVEPKTDEA